MFSACRRSHNVCYRSSLLLSYSRVCIFVCVEAVPDPLDLRSSDISTDSFRVSWQHPASDVVLYRLTWTPTDGRDSEDVRLCLSKLTRFLHKVETRTNDLENVIKSSCEVVYWFPSTCSSPGWTRSVALWEVWRAFSPEILELLHSVWRAHPQWFTDWWSSLFWYKRFSYLTPCCFRSEFRYRSARITPCRPRLLSHI